MDEMHEPSTYIIRIKGHLTQQWVARFEGMTYELTENGETRLIGQIADQAALHSLLRTIRDAGLELLSINQKT